MLRLGYCGFDHDAVDRLRARFEVLGMADWSLTDALDADAVVIDLDSMGGQFAWMRGFAPGQVAIGLTCSPRATTPYRLDAPLDAEALGAVLRDIAGARADGPGARADGSGAQTAGSEPSPVPARTTRFQLVRWPRVGREFPKHFRIATVMLKNPATVAEIAFASGASEADVADFVNAALAAGHAKVT